METGFNKLYKAFMKDSEEQLTFRRSLENSMKSLIPDVELQRKLIPKFEVGCRRINPENHTYLLCNSPMLKRSSILLTK